jgi:hypothetical protein
MVGIKAVEDFFKGRTTFIDMTSTDGSSCIGKGMPYVWLVVKSVSLQWRIYGGLA